MHDLIYAFKLNDLIYANDLTMPFELMVIILVGVVIIVTKCLLSLLDDCYQN